MGGGRKPQEALQHGADAEVDSPPATGGASPVTRHASRITCDPVETRRDLRDFIALQSALYAEDPAWVQPLFLEQKHLFSRRNPYFRHARGKFWIARDGRRAVGRISAQIDELRLQRYDDATGHFGVLEAVDDPEVFAALLGTAEDWLREQGMRRVIGPYNLSINGDIGILVEGFDTAPVFLTGHGRPYYDARVQEQGYRKTKDVVAYRMDTHFEPLRTIAESTRRARESGRLRFRPIDKSRLAAEVATISAIFNDAWADNWGFVPFTEAEFADFAGALKYLVPAELIQFAEVDGEPAAMIVLVPNLNEFLSDLHGRLFPFGWLPLLARLLTRSPRSARVAIMGVRRRFQRSSLAMAMLFGLVEAVREPVLSLGMTYLELGWVLEDNVPVLRVMKLLGGTECKRYRVYEKPL